MSKVITKRYAQWADAFSEFVGEKQKEIRKIEGHQSLYVVAKDVLDEMNLPNDVKITLREFGVQVTIKVLKNEYIRNFSKVSEEISKELLRKKLHETGKPSISNPVNDANGIDALRFHWTWRSKNLKAGTFASLILTAEYTDEGTADIVVHKETATTVPYTYTKYIPKWRESIADAPPVGNEAM